MRVIVGAIKVIISAIITFTYIALFMLTFAISYWSENLLFFMVVMSVVMFIGYGIHRVICWLLEEDKMKFISNAKYNTPVESGTIYRAQIENLDVIIHRLHGLDGWYLSCPVFKIDDYRLKSESLLAAVDESRKIIREKGIVLNEAVLKYCENEPTEIARY